MILLNSDIDLTWCCHLLRESSTVAWAWNVQGISGICIYPDRFSIFVRLISIQKALSIVVLLVILTLVIFISLIFRLLPSFLGQKDVAHYIIMDSFECGFERFSTSRLPFSLKFFLVVIVFLVFDIEIVILLPYCFIITNLTPGFLITGLGTSLIILLFGLLLEWYQGSFEWAA